MKYEEILSSIKNRVFSPIYFLHGEEAYFIDQICDAIDNTVLSEGEKDFNQVVVYGRETDIPTIISMAKRFPMMASHQVILVKEAQNIKKIDKLLSYVENPQPSTILVFCHKYGKIDGRKKVIQRIKKSNVLFESKKLYDNQISPWINSYIKAKGYSISPTASLILSEYLGSDLSKISNEIEKLIINGDKSKTIDELDVQEKIGISKDFNVFELQKALGKKNVMKSNQIINYFASDPKNHPLVMVIPILYNYFVNLGIIYTLQDKSPRSVASSLGINPYFVNDIVSAARNYSYGKIIKIISYLREYDAKSKGVKNNSSNNHDLMKELIFKILH
ncbi:MAG: DNA polymerase III subunit delta [Bacteroidetes bacterium]|nr:MAG: DNA polymerase III subunit delta [Bacteroidota bacterium]